MIKVGLIGVGFMGWIHYLAYRRSSAAQLVGFVSRDPKKRRGDWRGIRGNFGPAGEMIDISGMEVHDSLEAMLKNPAIDVVDICLPPHLHAQAALAAVQAGKHVFCEKPLALSSAEADRLLEAAERYGRQVMVAQVLPYIGPFAYALELVQSGKYGQPIGGMFKRTISNPDWIPDFFDPQRVGGPLIDLNVHDTHFIRLLFGKPRRVQAVGRMAVPSPPDSLQGCVKFAHAHYHFDDPRLVVASTGGVLDGPGRPFTHGFELQLEEAYLQFEFAAFADACETMPLKIVTKAGEVIRPELAVADDVTAFEHEIADMVQGIGNGVVAPRLDPVLARDAIHLGECIQRSVVEQRPIDV
jgi:predicted dehydrogenase